MRKKQDIMWEQSTLWESVEKWVTKYLKKNHSEYRELQVKAMRIVVKSNKLVCGYAFQKPYKSMYCQSSR